MSGLWGDLLPTDVEVNGARYAIRSDYRAIRDIMLACEDADLSDYERAEAVLTIFYPDLETIPPEDYQEAINRCFWFMNGGKAEKPDKKERPKLVDWEQDFSLIVAPVNKIIGTEIRALEYLHWWTFLAAFNEIGECTWRQVVKIRNYKAKNKPLDKSDRAWYEENRDLVDFARKQPTQAATSVAEWFGISE